MAIRISVILCTYNRCESLSKALEKLASSELPPSFDWEVVMVDNNSTDDTRNVTRRYIDRDPNRFRYVFQPQQGKSYALNAGIQAARGEVLAFTDDDAVVEPSWLWNLSAPLFSDKWSGVAGRTLPLGDFATPHWLSANEIVQWGGIIGGLFDFGMESREIADAPYGVNMAFRKELFERYGRFRTDLGPRPGDEIRNEDTEFGRRILAGGCRIWYESTAVAHHPVTSNRLTQSYFLKWWFDYGRALIREKGKGAAICGIPRHYFGIASMMLLYMPSWTFRWLFTLSASERFRMKCRVWCMAGQITETIRLGRQHRGVTRNQNLAEGKPIPSK